MANMKEFTIKVDVEGDKDIEKLKNSLKDIEVQTIKVVSAQEVLQGILTSSDPLKKIEKIIPAYNRMAATIDKITRLTPVGTAKMKELYEFVGKTVTAQLDGAKKISEASKKRLDEIKEEEQKRREKEKERENYFKKELINIEKLGKESAEYAEKMAQWERDKANTEKAFAAEFEEISKKRVVVIKESLDEMVQQTEKAYSRQEELIIAKYALEEQTIRNATNLTFATEEQKAAYKQMTKEDEVAMTMAQNAKLTDLEKRKNEELKKHEAEHQKAKNAIITGFMKERAEKVDVYQQESNRKVEKNAKKTAKQVTDFFKDIDEETKKAIIAESAKMEKEARKAAAATKETTAANKEAANAAKGAADATKKTADAAKEAADATKKTTEATKEATDASKKYLDIQATRANMKTEIGEFKDLQKAIQGKYEAQVKAYDEEIKAAGDNAEKRKEIEKKKAGYIKQYGLEIMTIQKEITTAEKKEQGLRYVQWQQYMKKAEEIASSIKDFTGKVGDYLSTGLSAASKVYQAEVAAIDEEINHLKIKKAEADKIVNGNSTYVQNLQAEKVKAEKEGNQEVVKSLEERIKNEAKLLAEAQDTKRSYEIKETELERKKAKKQAEQEKVDKLNRKATLLKNIGEATANVAQGVTKAWALGPFIGPVLAAVVAVAGAAQIGIMTKQLAKFEDGGLLRGKRHAQGGLRIEGTNIEVEGGEYVVNRESTDKNMGLIRYINSQRRELTPSDISSFFARTSQGFEPPFGRAFESGGQLPAVTAPDNVDNETLVEAIRSIRIEPRVAVSDINRVQDEMVSVDNWVGL